MKTKKGFDNNHTKRIAFDVKGIQVRHHEQEGELILDIPIEGSVDLSSEIKTLVSRAPIDDKDRLHDKIYDMIDDIQVMETLAKLRKG